MKLLTSILLVLISVSAYATTYVKQSVSTYFDNSEIVARIYVKKAELLESNFEGEQVGCGVRISAEIVESFKGGRDAVEFIIQGMVLNPAVEYLVFLEGEASKDVTPVTSTNSMMQSAAYKRSKACAKYHAGYRANWLNVSRFLRKWSSEDGKFEDWITPGYNVDIAEEDGVVAESVEIRSLLVNGKLIEKEYWSGDDGVVFPDEFWMYEGALQWESYRPLLLPNDERDNKRNHTD